MSIEQLVDNYSCICSQIKKSTIELMELRKRKAVIEKDLELVISKLDTNGIVSKGVSVYIEKKTKRTRVGQKQKKDSYINILNKYGLGENSERAFAELQECGEVIERNVVKLKGTN